MSEYPSDLTRRYPPASPSPEIGGDVGEEVDHDSRDGSWPSPYPPPGKVGPVGPPPAAGPVAGGPAGAGPPPGGPAEAEAPLEPGGPGGPPPALPPVRRRRPSALRNTIEWVGIVAVALLAAFLIKTYLIQAFYIPSPSMVPTLQVHDRVLVNKLSYDLHPIHRGDIIVFKRPLNEAASDPSIKDLIKRVIGLPGDVLEARDGQVYVNDHLLNEPYLPAGAVTLNLPHTVVPPGQYFVMGDNRLDSKDSRMFGPIPRDLVVGRAFVKVWPLSSLEFL